MSEAKRAPLQTLEFPEPLGHATKEKKGNMGKQLAPSFRFALTLPESNEKTCPEFNYAQLLKTAEKKRRKEQKREDENTTNGLDPFDEDDEDKLRDMAKRFEAKYGTSTMGKKRHKYDDYVDLGAGYDENDSFIDNTDAYDEIVPEEMTTAHGGFYINCGALEFRAADRRSLVHNNNNNNNSDDEESSESSEDDTEDVDSPKRVDKRIISSSEDDETEDITGDNPRKRRKIDESSEKKVNHENVKKRKKPQNHQTQDAQQQNSQQDLDLLRRKEKNETTDAEGGTASEDQEDKKKSDKPEKSKISEKKFDIKKFEKKSSNSNGYDAKKIDIKRLDAKDSNIDDAIESVVNAARGIEDDSSRDTTDSGKSRVCLYVESDGEEMENKEASLPENLPEDVRDIVNKLKIQAENSKDGKSKFFNSAVNEVLFTLEKKLRMLNSPSIRLQTYGHLVRFLPCSKITLLSRAKKLYLKDAEHRVNEPMQKLKTLIDNVMPSVTDKYLKECQKVADEKGFEGSPADAESSDEDDGSSKNAEKPKIPRKRFPWTDEAKKLVLEIANARRHYFKILRTRKESMESFVATFMDTNVLPLWPPGCVRLQTLLKYASPIEPAIKKKLKKPKEMVNANNVTTSANTQACNIVAKNDATSATNLSSQESEKTNTNVSKIQIVGENSTNFASQATAKSNDVNTDKKQPGNKYKDKHTENNAGQQQQECPGISINSYTVGKISVVPTAQLMAQKPTKSHVEKFNFMDLTNSSLSITRVDYDKGTGKLNEAVIEDRVSITACPEPVSHSKTNEISQAGHHSVYRQDTPYSSAQALKHRFLQENADAKCDKRLDDKDVDSMISKTDKKEKKRERCVDVKLKSSHDQKKRKKNHKMIEQQIGPNQDVVPMPQQTTLSKEEQEQRQNEETIAATNFLSQIINDDSSPRGLTDKRKDGFITDDTLGNAVQPTEQEKDVQMVMRSLKELQELQEMKFSPNNSPVGGTIQKPGKSNPQYVTYQEDYQRLYLKKEDKMRSKEEAQW
ncbi:PREDICTED: ubinuclein-2 isoform X2 [Vollenhovia emeryi]|uniref:ubinuclein-2 isoform X2 n=1 Tax=Vollenhovia emeryi TaxID=411798 RepID=UPI0005F4C58B|nr:PREDICTED: ubinuclein-2 isoform X2 [Vollenhovia emeryi]